MSRDDGFRIADVDVGILDDPKVRALVRSTRDESLVARCITGLLSVITASWAAGDRVSLDDAAPAWLTGLDDLRERLLEAALLDADGRLPERSWTAWYGPARSRQEAARERWRRANDNRRKAPSPRGDSVDTARRPQENSDGTVAFRPPASTDPTDRSEHTQEARAPEPVDDAEAVFALLEGRGVAVDRTNGHAKSLRTDVQRHGLTPVLTIIEGLPDLVTARQAAFAVRDQVAPIPKAASPKPARDVEAERAARTARIRAQRVEQFSNTGIWDAAWGPKPGEDEGPAWLEPA